MSDYRELPIRFCFPVVTAGGGELLSETQQRVVARLSPDLGVEGSVDHTFHFRVAGREMPIEISLPLEPLAPDSELVVTARLTLEPTAVEEAEIVRDADGLVSGTKKVVYSVREIRIEPPPGEEPEAA